MTTITTIAGTATKQVAFTAELMSLRFLLCADLGVHGVNQKVIDSMNEFFTYIVREPQGDNQIIKINRT